MMNKIQGKQIERTEQENPIIFLEEDRCLEFTIEKDTNLFIFSDGHSLDLTVHLMQNQHFHFFFSIMSQDPCFSRINIYHEGDHSSSTVICHGISYQRGNIELEINGYVPKGKKNCICNQESILHVLDQGKASIKPNLYMDEYQVEANHSSYVGPFKDDIVFYLQTKGIPKETGYQLLLRSFLIGDYEDEVVQERVNDKMKKIFM